MVKQNSDLKTLGSKDIASAAIKIALTSNRKEEKEFQTNFSKEGMFDLRPQWIRFILLIFFTFIIKV